MPNIYFPESHKLRQMLRFLRVRSSTLLVREQAVCDIGPAFSAMRCVGLVLPSDERTGINTDRYIGNPFASIAKVTHEVMVTRSILRASDSHVGFECHSAWKLRGLQYVSIQKIGPVGAHPGVRHRGVRSIRSRADLRHGAGYQPVRR